MRFECALSLVLTTLLLSDAQVSSRDGQYLIKQGVLDDGSIFMYSPYFLWHSEVYNKSASFKAPLELRSTNGLLDIQFTVQASEVKNDLFGYNSRTFCYNGMCGSPAPTLFCNPGDRIRLTLINELEDTGGVATVGPMSGEMKFPNRTNIYIQGLPLDPALNNPFRFTSGGGDSLVYNYQIPRDTPPGVHWYHSRVHGSAALQVMGGLFGAFIVEPTPTTATKDSNGVYTYTASLPTTLEAIVHHVVVFSHVMVQPPQLHIEGVRGETFSLIDEAGNEGFSNSSLSYAYLSKAYGSTMPVHATFNSTNITDAWLTNGKYQPTLQVQPGEWRVLDIVVASGDRLLELEIRTSVGYKAGNLTCDVRLLALDGVYLSETRTGPTVTHLTLLQSSRASVAVMCPTAGVFYLQTATSFDTTDPHYTIGDFQTKSSQNLMILNITGNTYIMEPPPTDLSSIARPARIISPAGVVLNRTAEVQELSLSTAQGGCCGAPLSCGARYWLGMGRDCKPACYGPLLCTALHSVLQATSSDHIYDTDTYNVSTFPTVRNGQCEYHSFSGYTNLSSSIHPRNACQGYDVREDALTVALAREYPDVPAAEGSPPTPTVNLGGVQEIILWGHADFPYPLFVQGNIMQLASFANVDASVSNIVDSGEYVLQADQNSTYYAQPGDFKEIWPSLTGKSKLYLQVRHYTGSVLVMSPFLKYEDMGALRNIFVQPAAHLPATPSAPPSPVVTPVGAPTVVEPPTAFPPRSALLDSDSAQIQFLCNTTGASFFYSEELDLTYRTRVITTHSCPNHFSVCQSNECGGAVKTRALITRQVVTVPLYPSFSAGSPIDTTCNTQMLGVALNGVGLYGLSDGKTDECVSHLHYTAAGKDPDFAKEVYGRTSCARPGQYDGLRSCGDGVREVARSIDKCGGYAGRDGVYKYLVTPTCLQAQLSTHAVREHSPQLGWALDGFPVYGPIGAKGVTMMPCGAAGAHPVLCLDVCNGYAGRLTGYDQFLYRYYFTGAVGSGECSSTVGHAGTCTREEGKCCVSTVPTREFRPYSIGCFRGCPYKGAIVANSTVLNDRNAYSTCTVSGRAGTVEEYVPYKAAFAKEVNVASNAVTSAQSGGDGEAVPVAVPTALPSTTSSGNVTIPANKRRVVTKSEFTSVVSIQSFDDAEVTADGTAVSPSFVAREDLVRSTLDAYITSMHIDADNRDVIYYTTQLGIYSYSQKSKVSTPIIAGMLAVEIEGFNLGATVSELRSIRVGDQTCTSVIHLSAERVRCLIVLREPSLLYGSLQDGRNTDDVVTSISGASSQQELDASAVPYRLDQVELTTVGGKTSGISSKPLTTVRSGSGRPTISGIMLTLLPFTPLAITVATHGREKTLYWSNVAYGARSIQRSRMDGTQVETVVSNVQRAVSLSVLTVHLDQAMKYVYTHASAVSNSTATAAQLAVPDCATPARLQRGLLSSLAEDQLVKCSTTGHVLFFADSQRGALASVTLLPISAVEVHVQHHVSLQDTKYYTEYHVQDELAPQLNAQSQPLPLIDGVQKISSFTLELRSRYVFLSAQSGLVLRLQLDNLLDTSSITALTPLYSLSTRDLLRGGASLPAWIRLLRNQETRARLHGLCALPIIASTIGGDGKRNLPAPWQQERVLVLDTNQQRLVGVSEEGIFASQLDVGYEYKVFWPHQIVCSEAAQVHAHTPAEEDALPAADVYVSEYLGRIWRLAVERDQSTGSFRLRDTQPPVLVMDLSAFPASIRLREILNNATAVPLFYDVQ